MIASREIVVDVQSRYRRKRAETEIKTIPLMTQLTVYRSPGRWSPRKKFRWPRCIPPSHRFRRAPRAAANVTPPASAVRESVLHLDRACRVPSRSATSTTPSAGRAPHTFGRTTGGSPRRRTSCSCCRGFNRPSPLGHSLLHLALGTWHSPTLALSHSRTLALSHSRP
jgi:hypothetical protein